MKRKTCSVDGCSYPVWARGKCKRHDTVGKTPIRKVTPKKAGEIKAAKIYYMVAIQSNIAKNTGKCICEECGKEILSPSGANVSHIISGGSNKALYLEPLNHFILCKTCENQWTNINPSTMKVWGIAQERKIILNNKYYSSIQ